MGLLNAVVISWLFVRQGISRWLIPAGLALYAFGLLAGAYAQTGYGFHINFNTRNGPFFTTIFFALGWRFSAIPIENIKLKWGIILAVLGCAAHMFEVRWLWQHNGGFIMTDYLLGTLPWGAGVAIIVLNLPEFGKNTILPRIGKYTLGIYAIHLLLADLFSPINNVMDSISWEVIFPLLVFALSAVSVAVLAKNSFTRQFVV
jgi:surface polysaccharide O-acyltransferase-like enzyme